MALPIAFPRSDDPRQGAIQKPLRIAAYVAFFAILFFVMIQFQHLTLRELREDADGSKGAIPRWRRQIHNLWDGENVYATELHPNMPFVTILLTPLVMLPTAYLALSISILKFLAIIATILMASRLAVDGDRKLADWILGLAMLWSLQILVSDLQHGNTNTFVLFFIVLHLWLFRRGQDALAGGALAMAICLKMTPALFVLYWLYQRQWRLLGTTSSGPSGLANCLARGSISSLSRASSKRRGIRPTSTSRSRALPAGTSWRGRMAISSGTRTIAVSTPIANIRRNGSP
jgi:hypothetical protein